MLVYFRLLKESFGFAMNALRNNKLRTLLSLLGVTIGIFSIIAVLAAVDSLDRKIKKELSSLDKNTIYLFKGTFGPSEVPRWKRDQFPNVTYSEYEYLKSSLPDAQELGYQIFLAGETVKYDSKSVTNVNVVPVSYEFIDIQGLEFSEGRFYNESEANSGATVTVIGKVLADNLFGDLEPIGKEIRLYGQRFKVIGVLKKQGAGMFGDDDSSAFIPVNFIRRTYGDNNKSMTPVIIIKPQKGIDMEAFKAEITQKLRNFRGMKTGEIDNFFINVFSGFGIQKSLGAKNRFILFQFLFEAIILCLIGGIIGIIMVWLIALLLTHVLDFEFVLSFSNIMLGSGLAIAIGLISGILPAISASKLDPVEAIRSGM
jgi:putative ABC transport system permease protein